MNTVLVTGATGNVGRPLVTRLVESGARVRAVTRHPDTAQFPPGVHVVKSATDGLAGVTSVFLNSRALGSAMASVVQAARRAGVTRLVALSAINADDDFSRQPSRFRGDRNREVEQLAVDSGLEWVSLRPSVFVTNFVGMWAPQLRAGDVVAGPYAQASMAPIAEHDIAAVATHALLTDDLVGRKVALTGPQALTNAELVDVVGGVLGRHLTYCEVPADEVRRRFVGGGFSAEFADAYIAMLSATLSKPALVTHEVERILGRAAAQFADAVSPYRDLFTKVEETSHV
jgi:uncharacterized protein YbjT (DUF2867 family)